jgi:hypothetical protein
LKIDGDIYNNHEELILYFRGSKQEDKDVVSDNQYSHPDLHSAELVIYCRIIKVNQSKE